MNLEIYSAQLIDIVLKNTNSYRSLPVLQAQLRGLMQNSTSPKHDVRACSEVRVLPAAAKSNVMTTVTNGNVVICFIFKVKFVTQNIFLMKKNYMKVPVT